jgi:hypothetical protein
MTNNQSRKDWIKELGETLDESKMQTTVTGWKAELEACEEKLKLAVSALEFYSKEENWSGSAWGIPSCITNQEDHDLIEFEGEKIHCGGKVARETLAKIKITEWTRK